MREAAVGLRPLHVGIAVSTAVLVVHLVGATLQLETLRTVTMWLLLPPLIVALVVAGAHRSVTGRWHLAGISLSWLGDGLGSSTGVFIVLLGCFLAGHVMYVVALWPWRSRSMLRPRPAALLYVALLVVALFAIVPSAGVLAVPVVGYGIVLTVMAMLAGLDRVGLVGGALFLASDLILGITRFSADIPDPGKAIVILGTYLAAQSLLAVSVIQRTSDRAGADWAAKAERSHHAR